jgi:hypothetical protein
VRRLTGRGRRRPRLHLVLAGVLDVVQVGAPTSGIVVDGGDDAAA